ncbi:FAD-binding protein [Hoyosella sp. YIM 151337]|uniref:D-arabinono-1,4-lactone oxidase n=1 Tax=Hoyosella sp. YIM 151337 TaxID=2992742 RepID=UPI0022362E9D|nr:D-arabinono-1,4-lactone oxidase [Hoyosella sp. YIM 151337]MCW4352420.1 FAD-binding protein [Hoyosella sp. YIM 151337]
MTTQWQNWSRTVTAYPARVLRPRSTDELCGMVRKAAEAEQTIRAWGSGHSFTPAAATNGWALDLSALSGFSDIDLTRRAVTVKAGTLLRDLNAALHTLGLALENLGDIDTQTVAGAISTGTHGTGARLGNLATQVLALELVQPDGSVVRCSAEEKPDLFAAARVSLGALGVISTVTLRCVPRFVLAANEQPEPIEQVLDTMQQAADANDHFEFFMFPYGCKALVKRNNRTADEPAPLSWAAEFLSYELIENRAFAALCRLGRTVPASVKPAGRIADAVLSARAYRDWSYRVFATPRKVRMVESEYAIPRGALAEVLTALRSLYGRLATPVAFPVEVRFSASDEIWLSPSYDRETAYVAVHQFEGMPYLEYFREFEAIARAAGGRPHWGKLHTLASPELGALYPRFDDFVRLRDELDPSRVFRNIYTDQVLP